MALRHPFQKLCFANREQQHLLLAASGPTINCISLEDDKLLYQWPTQKEESEDEQEENGDRPSKRRKLDLNGRNSVSRQQSEASDASIEIVAERKKGERKKSKFVDTKLPNVSHLLATSDGQYAIAVTAEDKAIRVFKIKSNGALIQQSQRSLPKKLCAIKLTKDEATILAADKFGDVHAVPLHQSEEWVRRGDSSQKDSAYKPSATELTVHTKGNLEALRQQLERRQNNPKKDGPEFERQLLLGHVSLLTDLAVGEGMVDGKMRPFILTADRDEHIRVSRGIPQAHIIETFCLGHQDFVTKLCISPSMPELLVAGNGESSLRLYRWQTGQHIQTSAVGNSFATSLRAQSTQGRFESLEISEGRALEKSAVSGIWPVPFSTVINGQGEDEHLLLVAAEGLPVLLTYALKPEGLTLCNELILRGNVLDVVFLASTQQALVSIDTVHKSGSVKLYRDATSTQDDSFQMLQFSRDKPQATTDATFTWEEVPVTLQTSKIIQALPEAPPPTSEENSRNKGYEKVFSSLGEFLYGLENLRKKRDYTMEDEVDMEAEEVEEADALKTEGAASA